MIAFPSMIAESATKAGMKVPADPDADTGVDPVEYPHFALFCALQLGRPLSSWDAHWQNAEVIMKLPEGFDIYSVTYEQIISLGWIE